MNQKRLLAYSAIVLSWVCPPLVTAQEPVSYNYPAEVQVFKQSVQHRADHLRDRTEYLHSRLDEAVLPEKGDSVAGDLEKAESMVQGIRRQLRDLPRESPDAESWAPQRQDVNRAVEEAETALLSAARKILPEKEAYEWKVESELFEARTRIDYLKAKASRTRGVPEQEIRDTIAELQHEIQRVQTGLKIMKAEQHSWKKYRTDLNRELQSLESQLR